MPGTPVVSSPITGRGSSGTPKQGNGTSTAVNPNNCAKCSKVLGKKAVLKCECCHISTHTACLSDWTDIKNDNDLNKITSRSGLLWYCGTCLPKLPQYFYAPGVQPAIDNIGDKIESLTKLVADSYKITRTYAQVADDTKESGAEVRERLVKLEECTKQQIQERERLERKQSAIIHNVKEDINTHTATLRMLSDIGFTHHSATKISRLGAARTERSSSTKPRPIKIQFRTEIMKIDFLRVYNSWDQRTNTFATPDLSKEEQEREYRLRMRRNQLSAQHSSNKYRVRNGELQQQVNGEGDWVAVGDNDTNDTVAANPSG